jgi:hypothetical protein
MNDFIRSIVKEALEEVVSEMTTTGAVAGFSTPHAFKKKKKLKESEDTKNPLYVEFIRELPGEDPFMLGGQKYQYVKAKYPDGKEDIGVYAFAGDIVYGYNAFRQMNNIKEAEQPEPYDAASDSFAPAPRQRPEEWEAQTTARNPAEDKKLLQWAAQRYQRENNPSNRDTLLKVIKLLKSDLGL